MLAIQLTIVDLKSVALKICWCVAKPTTFVSHEFSRPSKDLCQRLILILRVCSLIVDTTQRGFLSLMIYNSSLWLPFFSNFLICFSRVQGVFSIRQYIHILKALIPNFQCWNEASSFLSRSIGWFVFWAETKVASCNKLLQAYENVSWFLNYFIVSWLL